MSAQLPPLSTSDSGDVDSARPSTRSSAHSTHHQTAHLPSIDAPRPSGRHRIKSSDIGVKTQRPRKFNIATLPASSINLAAYKGSLLLNRTGEIVGRESRNTSIRPRDTHFQQQQQDAANTSGATSGHGIMPVAYNGSLTARSRVSSSQSSRGSAPTSGAQSARPSRRQARQQQAAATAAAAAAAAAGQQQTAPKQLEEEKAQQSQQQPTPLAQQQVWAHPLPEWLNSPYPPPQPPKEMIPDPLFAASAANPSVANTGAYPNASISQPGTASGGRGRMRDHPHELHLPSSNSFQYYRPISPTKRHECEGGPTSHLRHYMYAHLSKSRSNSPNGGRGPAQPTIVDPLGQVLGVTSTGSPVQPAGSGNNTTTGDVLSQNAAEIAPEAWSSWPFVNPRLIREESKQQHSEEKQQDSNPKDGESNAEEASKPPTLPTVGRLFASVVTEYERTLVFEYLRSTYSQLFQWPPQQANGESKPAVTNSNEEEAKEVTAEEKQKEESGESAAATTDKKQPPPLPTVLFTDADLDRLIEESRTASGCITLLRRLDAELALAILNGTLGQTQSESKKNEHAEKTPTDAADQQLKSSEEAPAASVANTTTTDESSSSSSNPNSDSHSNLLSPSMPLSSSGSSGFIYSHQNSSSALLGGSSSASSYAILPLGPPPPPVEIPMRSPPVQFQSAQELIAAVTATRVYLNALRRKQFQWFAFPSSPLSLFCRANGTVFITQGMIDSMLNSAAALGLSEEEVSFLIENLNARAANDMSFGYASFDELAERIHIEAKLRMAAALNPAAASVIAAQNGLGLETNANVQGVDGNNNLNNANLNSSTSPSSDPEARPPSPSLVRHAQHSQAYARLLLFKFLRDGEGKELFSEAQQVAATVSEMDALLEATKSLTLGTNYQVAWYPKGKEALVAATTSSPTNTSSTSPSPPTTAAVTVNRSMSRPMSRLASSPSRPISAGTGEQHDVVIPQPRGSTAGSKTNTRPPSPHHQSPPAPQTDANATNSGDASNTGSAFNEPAPPGATTSVAASTRAYGSFLASRAIRVLRSLLFHGYTAFQSFSDLIMACEIQSRKLREERVKVFEFLSASNYANNFNLVNPTNSQITKQQRLMQQQHFLNQLNALQLAPEPINETNGLFNSYYEEMRRREKARLEAEAARLEKLKSNTHQFGTHHLELAKEHGKVVVDDKQAFQELLHQHSTSSRKHVSMKLPIPNLPHNRHHQRTSSTASTTGGGGGSGGVNPNSASQILKNLLTHTAKEAKELEESQKNYGKSKSNASPSSSPVQKEHNPLKYFDWGLQGDAEASQSDIKASAALSRYTSAKTLPYTASKSVLLRHSDAPALENAPIITLEPLPPLSIAPEDVDALFGSFDHFLQPINKDQPNVLPTSGSFGVAAAPSAVFDPLVEQDDEDYLLESEPEEAYNSMDLTLLLQTYKQEHPKEYEQKGERGPSYLSAHPLYKPMLEQLAREQASRDQENQDQEGHVDPSQYMYDAYESGEDPNSLDEYDSNPYPAEQYDQHPHMADGVSQVMKVHEHEQQEQEQPHPVEEQPVASTTTEPTAASAKAAPSEAAAPAEDPLNPSASTAIPTLESLLNPQPATEPPATNSSPATEVTPVVTSEATTQEASAAPPAEKSVPPIVTTAEAVPNTEQSASAESTESAESVEVPVILQLNNTPIDANSTPVVAAAQPTQPVPVESLAPAPVPAPVVTAVTTTPTPATPTTLAASSPPIEPASSPRRTAAEEYALDTSKDLIILDPNADFERWNALGPSQVEPQVAPHDNNPHAVVEEPPAPLPKMLPVVLQTMQLLREQGKIKLNSSSGANPAVAAAPTYGPAGPGTGLGLPQFIPNSGAPIPGGSMGSVKTLHILRELARSQRGFFSVASLVQTVCSMRSERKWQRRMQEAEKKKLIAAGITIATASGIPNDAHSAAAPKAAAGAASSASANTAPPSAAVSSSNDSSATPLSQVQFNVLNQSNMGKKTRNIQVVDSTSDLTAAAGGRPGSQGARPHSRGHHDFPDPSHFPSTLPPPLYPAPPSGPPPPTSSSSSSSTSSSSSHAFSLSRRRNARGEVIAEEELPPAPPTVDFDRAWSRARLLTHLSSLLLFQGAIPITPAAASSSASAGKSGAHGTAAAPSPPSAPVSEVVIRMSDVEALLDALSHGPRDAQFLAEKVARKEREALTKDSHMKNQQGKLALQILNDLPPISHPITPLLAVLTWLDSQELLFHSMKDLVNCLVSGQWAKEYRAVERSNYHRKASEQDFINTQLNHKVEAETEKLRTY